ncbi:MAG: HlyD family secretion protein [Phycisphaerales bacterium]
MIVRTILIPALAVGGLAFAMYTAQKGNMPLTPAQPVAEPARSPFSAPVAGAGIVESSTQNIAVGTSLPGVVQRVHVRVGQKVKAGEPLFSVDDRAVRAELAVRAAMVTTAQAALRVAERSMARLSALPRAEEVLPLEARVNEMAAMVEDMRAQVEKVNGVTDDRAVSQEEKDKRRSALAMAEARLSASFTELALTKAGAWRLDVEIQAAQIESARSSVQAAEAEEAATRTELDRLTVRAPTDGTVLQLNVRVGEFAQAGPTTTPLILFGDTSTLHVRIDVDENDAWKIRPEARAVANLRGNSALRTDLSFVRVEPYVIPKRSLTGDSSERVDTRVLQVIYSFQNPAFAVYVGQQMDVFIDAAP